MNKAILIALAGLASGAASMAFPVPPLPPVDNGLMTNVPNYGPSRVETVNMCLADAGVAVYQELITDYHWAVFERCLEEQV